MTPPVGKTSPPLDLPRDPRPERARRERLWVWGMGMGTVAALGIWLLVWDLVDPTTGAKEQALEHRGRRTTTYSRACAGVELNYHKGSHTMMICVES